VAKEHAPTSGEFFRLLAKMLNHAYQNGVSIQGVDRLLEMELAWLLKVRVRINVLYYISLPSHLVLKYIAIRKVLFLNKEHHYTMNLLLFILMVLFLLVQEDMLKTGQCSVESPLLDGHLCLTVELLAFRSISEKYKIGSDPNGQQLIKVNSISSPLLYAIEKGNNRISNSVF